MSLEKKEGRFPSETPPFDCGQSKTKFIYCALAIASSAETLVAYGAALTSAWVVKKSLSTAPMLMYQHSRSGVSMPGR